MKLFKMNDGSYQLLNQTRAFNGNIPVCRLCHCEGVELNYSSHSWICDECLFIRTIGADIFRALVHSDQANVQIINESSISDAEKAMIGDAIISHNPFQHIDYGRCLDILGALRLAEINEGLDAEYDRILAHPEIDYTELDEESYRINEYVYMRTARIEEGNIPSIDDNLEELDYLIVTEYALDYGTDISKNSSKYIYIFEDDDEKNDAINQLNYCEAENTYTFPLWIYHYSIDYDAFLSSSLSEMLSGYSRDLNPAQAQALEDAIENIKYSNFTDLLNHRGWKKLLAENAYDFYDLLVYVMAGEPELYSYGEADYSGQIDCYW